MKTNIICLLSALSLLAVLSSCGSPTMSTSTPHLFSTIQTWQAEGRPADPYLFPR